jgi:large subunit ribosomal protein L10
MSKQVKKLLAEDLRKSITGVCDVLVVSIDGIDGIQNNQMRLALRKKNIRVQVVKNSLAKRLFGEIGLSSAAQFLEGPSAVAWGGPSIVELAKEITQWASKVKKLQIKGGSTSGLALTPEQVSVLSKLPPREELIGRVVNLALSPARRVAALMNSPASRLVGQLKAKADAAAPEAAAPEAAAPEAAAPEAAAPVAAPTA